MICKTCGTHNDSNAKFCVGCGKNLLSNNLEFDDNAINETTASTKNKEDTNSKKDNNTNTIFNFIKKNDVICIFLFEIILLIITLLVMIAAAKIGHDKTNPIYMLLGIIIYILSGAIISFFTLDLNKDEVTFGRFKFKKVTNVLHNLGCLGWLIIVSFLIYLGPGFLLNILIFSIIRNNEKNKLMSKFNKSDITDLIANVILSVKDQSIYFGAGVYDILCLDDLEKGEFLSVYNYAQEGLPNLTVMEAEALTKVLGARLTNDFELITIPDALYPDGLYLLKRKSKNNISRNW